MARVFITGSADGLGRLAARALIQQGHRVVIHARNTERARDAREAVPDAEAVLIGDLTRLEEMKRLAAEVNALGRFNAVIHNAGVYQAPGKDILAVNTLAPYVLTCLIRKPQRLIYISSGLHLQGDPSMKPLASAKGGVRYADSKLYVVLFMKAVARLWPDVCANAVDPGWVPTRMGGRGAPDDLELGFETQVWLAVGEDDNAKVSGRHLFHKSESRDHPATAQPALQEEFLAVCEQVTGIRFPKGISPAR